MDDRIKVVYSWIGPRGPIWNTELPNILSLAAATYSAKVDGRFFTEDFIYKRLFSERKDIFDIYPALGIDHGDSRPFIVPYTLFWRTEFELYFLGRTGILEFSHLPGHLIDLIRNKNGYILIDHSVEAFMSDKSLNALHGYFESIHGLPLYKIIYTTGCINAKELYEDYCNRKGIPDTKEHRLTIVPYSSSAYLFKGYLTEPEDEPTYDENSVPEKLFLGWNRRFRPHRLEVGLHLEDLRLVDRSYLSFSREHIEQPTETFLSQALHQRIVERYSDVGMTEETLHRFNSKLPLILDNETEIHRMCSDEDHSSRPYYQNSLVSIITETNFSENEVTLTEKSFKPFKEKHPFISVAGPGALKHLREIGFRTFSEFWDESYDSETNPDERMIKIRNVFETIGSWDHNQILDFRRRVKPLLEHNFQMIKNLSNDHLLIKITDLIRNNIN